MDPDKALADLLELAHDADALHYNGTADMLAERVINLTEWLAKGGFPPNWKAALEKAKAQEVSK
jgi:hypothetical protein